MDIKYHHIFVLDASGSMSGSSWQSLISAVEKYIDRRLQTTRNSQDLVSIVTFDHIPLIQMEAEQLS